MVKRLPVFGGPLHGKYVAWLGCQCFDQRGTLLYVLVFEGGVYFWRFARPVAA